MDPSTGRTTLAGNSSTSGHSVTSKVIAILLTFNSGSTHSLTEIAQLAGLPLSTAHRLVGELAGWGILERGDDGQYRPGGQWRAVCGAPPVPAPINIRERVRRVMEDLAVATSRTDVRIGVLHGIDVVYIEKRRGNRPVSMVDDASAAPAHASAMGKALLAFAPPHVVEEVIAHGLTRYTPFTVTRPERLRRTLAVIRLTRLALCRREFTLSDSAVAAPVFGTGGNVVAALEIETHDPVDLRGIQPPLIMASRSLSRDFATVHNGGNFDLARVRTAMAARAITHARSNSATVIGAAAHPASSSPSSPSSARVDDHHRSPV
jgi:DNA-binding IclR family transcriptional regulator